MCGGADKRRVVWMLAKTQSHGEFFMAQFRIVVREVFGKIALVMAGPPAHGAFEQPFANPVFRAAAHLTNLAQQG